MATLFRGVHFTNQCCNRSQELRVFLDDQDSNILTSEIVGVSFLVNLVIYFCPGHLGTKPDMLTKQWGIYPKGGDNGYTSVNPHNFCPVFTHKQIVVSLQVTILTTLILCAAMILDQNQLYSNILAALPSNSSISKHLLCLEKHWSKDNAGFLRLDNRMYVLDNTNLCLQVLQYHHDHVLAEHLDQNKTQGLVQRHYTWPNTHNNV